MLLAALATCRGPDLPDPSDPDSREAVAGDVHARRAAGTPGPSATMPPALRLAFIQNHQRHADESYTFARASPETLMRGPSRQSFGTALGSNVFARNRAHTMSVVVDPAEGVTLSSLGVGDPVLSLQWVRYGRSGRPEARAGRRRRTRGRGARYAEA